MGRKRQADFGTQDRLGEMLAEVRNPKPVFSSKTMTTTMTTT
jgi:hypothetical protein